MPEAGYHSAACTKQPQVRAQHVLLAAGIIVAFVLAGAFYAFRIPLWEAPDESLHLTRARDLSHGQIPLAPRERTIGVEYHPPLYYALTSPVVGLADGRLDESQTSLFRQPRSIVLAARAARLFSVLLGALTLVVVYHLSRLLLEGQRRAIAALALTALTPAFLMTSSTVNDDSAAMLFSTLALLGAAKTVKDERATRRWPLQMAVAAMAAWTTKVTTLFLLPIVVLAGVWWLTRMPRRTAIAVAGSSIVTAGVGLWLASNGDFGLGNRFDSISRGHSVFSPNNALATLSSLDIGELSALGSRVITTYWSPAGWQSFEPLNTLQLLLLTPFGLLVLCGLMLSIRRLRGRSVVLLARQRVFLLAALALSLVILEMLLTDAGEQGLRDQGVAHARYILPAVGLMSTALIGAVAGLPNKWRSAALAYLICALLIIHVTATFSGPASPSPSGPLATTDALSVQPRVAMPPAQFDGGIDLVGIALDPPSATQGEDVAVSLYWLARERITKDVTVFVHLVDTRGSAVLKSDQIPTLHRFPPRVWRPGDIVRDSRLLTLPQQIGVFQVHVGMYRGDPAVAIPIRDGAFSRPTPERVVIGDIVVRPSRSEVPSMAPIRATFDSHLLLNGYSVEQTGARLGVTLYWQKQEAVDRDVVASLQLIDPLGRLAAQVDLEPGGLYPTALWQQGETVPDRRELLLPADRQEGQYVLGVAVYNRTTGNRLPVHKEGARQPGNMAALTVLHLLRPE